MTTLITLLISLLGYGTPSDFSNMTEDELNTQIEIAQTEQNSTDGGTFGDWDSPGVTPGNDNGTNP